MSKYFPEPDNPPDMVRDLQRASRINHRIQEQFQRLTSNLYLAIVDGDLDREKQLKTKLNAISEILTDV
jgi:hypothetical protein